MFMNRSEIRMSTRNRMRATSQDQDQEQDKDNSCDQDHGYYNSKEQG